MEPEWLSDVELVELVRAGGDSARPALLELANRHFGAVRTFAALCVNRAAAADQLAERAWQLALWQHGSGGGGALRPHALASVLEAAAETAGTVQQATLDPGLAGWLGVAMTEPGQGVGGGDVAILHSGSKVTRAFHALPAKLQTVLWHHLVEHADAGEIGLLVGSDSRDSKEISSLLRRAYRDFYHAYEQIHHDGMMDDCRRFHRMVMAYADNRGGNTADVVGHLEQCHYCSRAVADLQRMYTNLGELLVELVLPWGGVEYAASRYAERAPATVAVAGAEDLAPVREAATEEIAPVPAEDHRGALGRATWDVLEGTGLAERRTGGLKVRAGRLGLAIGVLGASSLVAAAVYAPGFGSWLPVSSGAPPAQKAPKAPAPSKSGDPGPSRTDSPPPGGGSDKSPSKPPGDGGGGAPAVKGAVLEWLFDDVEDGVTRDGTDNDRDGTLAGDPPPKPLKDGGIAFFGQQSVTSRDPVLDTDRSFSVSARVKLSDVDEYQTVASQDGAEVSSFQLQFDPVEDRFEMRMHREDTRTSPADEAESDAAPRAGRWTALAGVYDAAEGEIRLYVDGKLQDSVERKSDKSSEGAFAVGRARLGDQFIRGFDGTIKDVRAFSKALTNAEAKSLAEEK